MAETWLSLQPRPLLLLGWDSGHPAYFELMWVACLPPSQCLASGVSHRRPPSRDELLSTFVFQYTSPAFVFDFASIAACDAFVDRSAQALLARRDPSQH